MILVDSSVVIDFARKDPKLIALIPTMTLAICGVTRAEVLHGTRDPSHRPLLIQMLNSFQQIPIAEALWDMVGDHLSMLRTNGVTVPFNDVVIATHGIDLDIEVWTRDQQFTLIQTVLPALRFYHEPP